MRDRLEFAVEVLVEVNKVHSFEIFQDITFDPEQEHITFNCAASMLHHAIDVCRVLNLTFYHEAAGDVVKYYIQP